MTFVGSHLGCRQGWRGYQGNCYQVVERQSVSISESRDACRRLGGDLASIHNQEQQNFIHSYAKEAS